MSSEIQWKKMFSWRSGPIQSRDVSDGEGSGERDGWRAFEEISSRGYNIHHLPVLLTGTRNGGLLRGCWSQFGVVAEADLSAGAGRWGAGRRIATSDKTTSREPSCEARSRQWQENYCFIYICIASVICALERIQTRQVNGIQLFLCILTLFIPSVPLLILTAHTMVKKTGIIICMMTARCPTSPRPHTP